MATKARKPAPGKGRATRSRPTGSKATESKAIESKTGAGPAVAARSKDAKPSFGKAAPKKV
ncbi:MAG: transcriptional regulator, partial [Mesorhizobium sp.]